MTIFPLYPIFWVIHWTGRFVRFVLPGVPSWLHKIVTALILLAGLALLAAVPPAHAQTVVPDPTLTPGAVRTTDTGDVCRHGTNQLRHMTRERSDKIMASYDLPGGRHPDYELDHLIPLGIGGDDNDLNVWPEPRATIEPQWNAERKDRLEAKLRALVCGGGLDIKVAQKAIADDWTEAWLRYVGEQP
jgi:hypothetical protein